MTQAPVRKARPQLTLQVLRTEQLGPHLVRLWLGDGDFGKFADNGLADHYVKIWFAKPELGLTPPYDVAALRETLAPEDLPVTRTYTIRAVTPDSIAIDFVVHGDEGLAGPWAAAAQPGEPITFNSPGGGYTPDPTADHFIVLGDESALPAIASVLEALPSDATGTALIEVYGPADELSLTAPAGVDVRWIHRGDAPAGTTTLLPEALAALPWPNGRVQVFAHGEREAMKAVRDVVKPRGVDRKDLSLSGYWAFGRAEDKFQAEKREPIGVILP